MAIELTDKKLQGLMRKTVDKRTETRDTQCVVRLCEATRRRRLRELRPSLPLCRRSAQIAHRSLSRSHPRRRTETGRESPRRHRRWQGPRRRKGDRQGHLKAAGALAVERVIDRFITEYIEVGGRPALRL